MAEGTAAAVVRQHKHASVMNDIPGLRAVAPEAQNWRARVGSPWA